MTARKGVKGEKELPSLPPLVARYGLPAIRRVGLRFLFSGEIFAKRKEEIIYSFPCPTRPCAENIFCSLKREKFSKVSIRS